MKKQQVGSRLSPVPAESACSAMTGAKRRPMPYGRWLLGAAALLLFALPAQALIKRLTPLSEVLQHEKWIVVAKVERIDPEAPGMVLSVTEDLKGQPEFRTLAVNLAGSAAAQKEKQTAQLLRRLAPGLPLVLFVSPRGTGYSGFAYTNGTWFHFTGARADERLVWSFVHCEPYLRRTFAGTTAELRDVIRDGLSGKRKPPPPDPKAKPGLGPELPSPK